MAMQCQVLLFAHLRESIGRERLALDLPDGATVADALSKLASSHASIAQVRNRLAVAVNERYAAPSSCLKPGDVIALIPPVSGG
jgi:molybdopterin converting factor subunit 1